MRCLVSNEYLKTILRPPKTGTTVLGGLFYSMTKHTISFLFLLALAGFLAISSHAERSAGLSAEGSGKVKVKFATLAGGCFWCMEPPFEKLDGVFSVVSGYSGGAKANPSYQAVSSGKTQHAEAIRISYDANKISYKEILDVFWRNIDPTTKNGQFADKGPQYRSAIFYNSPEQKLIAERSRDSLRDSKVFSAPIVTEITEFKNFYPAEDYHQDFYKKNPARYNSYRIASGRASFLKQTWKGKK